MIAICGDQVKAEKEAAKEAGEEDEGPLEVEGFLFKRLMERKPELRQELLTFRDHLLATSSGNEALKACSVFLHPIVDLHAHLDHDFVMK